MHILIDIDKNYSTLTWFRLFSQIHIENYNDQYDYQYDSMNLWKAKYTEATSSDYYTFDTKNNF